MVVYGPYIATNGRKFVVKIYPDKTRYSQWYSRYLMEMHLGRQLEPHETVDHINGDSTDDRIENYQIMSLEDNIDKSLVRFDSTINYQCVWCGSIFKPTRHQRGARAEKKAGPFCSRTCTGQYGASVRFVELYPTMISGSRATGYVVGPFV